MKPRYLIIDTYSGVVSSTNDLGFAQPYIDAVDDYYIVDTQTNCWHDGEKWIPVEELKS